MTLILSGTDGLSDVDGTAATPAIRGTDANTGIFFPAADTIAFSEGGVEAMRIDSSGNVGIGTASPQTKLDVSGGSLRINEDGAGTKIITVRSNFAGVGPAINVTTNDPLLLMTNNTERARIDSSGNVGIGTSSSAGKLSVNVDASTEMITFRSSSGRQIFAHEPGGNARPLTIKAQTLTYADDSSTRLVVDSSGNVGIGTSSPSTFGKVAVEVAGTTTPTSLTTVGPSSINLYAATNGVSTNGTTGIFGWTATTGIGSGIGFSRENSADWGTQIRFYTHPTATSNIGDITERMRIDSSGNLLVGVTSGTSYKLSLKTSLASQSAIGTAGTSGDTAFQSILVTKFDNDSTTSQNFIQFQINNGGANCGKITANGANTAAFGSTSDQRVKENIAELPSQLANIMALRPVEFDYLESYGGGHQIGFIAQEIQQVYPDVISTDDSSEKIMSITGWSKTEARLVKAIQEQQALITQLTARITALEGA